jgi:hypothetical protein
MVRFTIIGVCTDSMYNRKLDILDPPGSLSTHWEVDLVASVGYLIHVEYQYNCTAKQYEKGAFL